MIIVNFYAGPGTGKSTMAARVFSELKEKGINAELVTEYAKDLCWQNSLKVLENQIYVFAKQFHRIWRLIDNVDVIVTDSPLLLSLVYGTTSEHFKNLVLDEFGKFDNLNIFLKRLKAYNPKGRNQSFEEAKELDGIIKAKLDELKQPYVEFNAGSESVQAIVDLILDRKDGRRK